MPPLAALIEPQAANELHAGTEEQLVAAISIAISLKRIADALTPAKAGMNLAETLWGIEMNLRPGKEP